MQGVMQDTVDGKHGEVPPDLRALAVDGLAHRKLETNMQRVSEAMQKMLEALQQPAEAWESRWRHVRDLHEQAKAVTDLILEVPEPQRTALMRLMLPLLNTPRNQDGSTHTRSARAPFQAVARVLQRHSVV